VTVGMKQTKKQLGCALMTDSWKISVLIGKIISLPFLT
jgi:hypothetical protein